jgi:hypothetical protein
MEDFKKSFDKIDTVFDKLKGLDAKVNDASPLKKFALLQKAGKMDLGKFTKAVSKKADALKNAKKSKPKKKKKYLDILKKHKKKIFKLFQLKKKSGGDAEIAEESFQYIDEGLFDWFKKTKDKFKNLWNQLNMIVANNPKTVKIAVTVMMIFVLKGGGPAEAGEFLNDLQDLDANGNLDFDVEGMDDFERLEDRIAHFDVEGGGDMGDFLDNFENASEEDIAKFEELGKEMEEAGEKLLDHFGGEDALQELLDEHSAKVDTILENPLYEEIVDRVDSWEGTEEEFFESLNDEEKEFYKDATKVMNDYFELQKDILEGMGPLIEKMGEAMNTILDVGGVADADTAAAEIGGPDR